MAGTADSKVRAVLEFLSSSSDEDDDLFLTEHICDCTERRKIPKIENFCDIIKTFDFFFIVGHLQRPGSMLHALHVMQ